MSAAVNVAELFGATGTGWNGVQISQVAWHAPMGQAVARASGFITVAGVVSGPPLFAMLAAVVDSYRGGFLVFGTACLIYGRALLMTCSENFGPLAT